MASTAISWRSTKIQNIGAQRIAFSKYEYFRYIFIGTVPDPSPSMKTTSILGDFESSPSFDGLGPGDEITMAKVRAAGCSQAVLFV